ncbi:MAG: DUF881 domain-containing protein [Actinomycetota bacterium]|nr:DUF881 domain-containing protein [Actinomycetota bacterium]
MTGSESGLPRTAQLLVDLVTDTLDPGYAAAARRRPDAARRWFDRPAVAIGCALAGFILVVAYIHTHRGAPEAAKVHDRLVARVHAAQRDDTTLNSTVQTLTSTLNQLREKAGLGSLAGRLNREQLLAGQVALSGPGLQVVLTEPPATTPSPQISRAGSAPIMATNILTDRDVRSVVNQLWAAGAEAISVNDVRLTPTSAIRFAGQAVLVDFQPISSPYTIRAIGNANDLATGFAASDVASRYQTLASADGIGFQFTEHASLTLPASAPFAPRFAVVPSSSPIPISTPTGTKR